MGFADWALGWIRWSTVECHEIFSMQNTLIDTSLILHVYDNIFFP